MKLDLSAATYNTELGVHGVALLGALGVALLMTSALILMLPVR